MVVTLFKVESEGFQALTELKQSAVKESYFVTAATLVKKENNGCVVLDGFDTVIARFDEEVVAKEVYEAGEMQLEMARQARMQLRKEKKEAIREELKENMEILSANLK